MTLDWQSSIALVIVAASVGYVARTVWHAVGKRKSACGGCGNCSSTGAAGPQHVVQISSHTLSGSESEGNAASDDPRLP
jgi:hypothetical protein